jgi:hypothetical protein
MKGWEASGRTISSRNNFVHLSVSPSVTKFEKISWVGLGRAGKGWEGLGRVGWVGKVKSVGEGSGRVG